MILTHYDKHHLLHSYVKDIKDAKIESKLKNGDKMLSFVHMDENSEIELEHYLRTDQDEYVVREINRTTAGFPVVYATLNLGELEGKALQTFQVTDSSISAAATLAIDGTGWTVAGGDVVKTRSISLIRKSALSVLQDLCTLFMCDIVFDSINKQIWFYERRGRNRGTYFLAGLNLKQLTKKSDSYNLYTRIFPYGADGLDIKSVNNGVEYLDNHQYSDKVRGLIWEDTNYTDATALKNDAADKLADMSKPKVSYSVQIIDLAKMSDGYSLFEYEIGDTITLIDKSTGTRDTQRIVKLTEYPDEPDRNSCELSNVMLTWEEMQAKLQAAAALADKVIGSDGNYNGTIKVSEILNFEDNLRSATGTSESAIHSDNTGAFVYAKNSVACIVIAANADGSVGIYEGAYPFTTFEAMWERVGRALHTESDITIGSNGLLLKTDGNIEVAGINGYNDAQGIPCISNSTNTARVSALAANGSATLQVTGQWNSRTYSTMNIAASASDKRLKENIKDCSVEALPVINAIHMRQFDWKQDGKHQDIGVIADELEKLDKRLAVGGGENDDGIMNVKSVDTLYLIGYLIKAVQELSAEVAKLEKEVR